MAQLQSNAWRSGDSALASPHARFSTPRPPPVVWGRPVRRRERWHGRGLASIGRRATGGARRAPRDVAPRSAGSSLCTHPSARPVRWRVRALQPQCPSHSPAGPRRTLPLYGAAIAAWPATPSRSGAADPQFRHAHPHRREGCGAAALRRSARNPHGLAAVALDRGRVGDPARSSGRRLRLDREATAPVVSSTIGMRDASAGMAQSVPRVSRRRGAR